MKIRFRLVIITLLFFSFQNVSAQNQPGNKSIELHATGFRNNTGRAGFAVYNNPKTFCNESIKPFREVGGVIVNHEAYADVYDLPDGEYAITLVHDENDDKLMNYNFIGLPKEGYGFSNNPAVRFSKPSFQDCMITVKKGVVVKLVIKAKYLFN